jgi:uncharacterized iron-regulated membrane protein
MAARGAVVQRDITLAQADPKISAPAAVARKHALRSWHRWGGVVATVVLLIAALSGLPLVYKKQLIHWLVTPEATLPAEYGVGDMHTELDRIAQLVPAIELYLIKAPNPEEPYWTLTAADGHLQLFAIQTLAPLTRNAWLLDALVVTRELHVALLAGLFGEYLLLLGGIIGVALGITGLILWWPARKGFRWRWVLPTSFKIQLLMQYHRHSGALSSIIVVLVILSGSLMLWQSLVFALLPPLQTTLQQDRFDTATAMPSSFLLRATQAIPDGWPTYIRLGNVDSTDVSVRFRLPGEWHPNGRTSVTFVRDSGEISVSRRSDEASPGRVIVNQFYPLHSGYGMNQVYLLLVFVSGISLTWLALTGIISFFRRN